MAKKTKRSMTQSDSTYVLKLVLYLILGSQWLFFTNDELVSRVPIPLGFLIGLIFTAHEHFKIDRKIEYALLLVAMLGGFWTETGLLIQL